MDKTNVERQRRYMARLKAAAAKGVTNGHAIDPLLTATQQELAHARAEVERLRAVANAAVSDADLRRARQEAVLLRAEVAKLKAKMVKPPKVQPDPESEAARQIEVLKTRNKKLTEESQKYLRQLRSLVPSTVKAKVAKALHEQSTSIEARLDALQAWNGLGLNNIGK